MDVEMLRSIIPNPETLDQRNNVDREPFLCGLTGWKIFLIGIILPLLTATFLYSVILTDDLFGDEFIQYRWSVLNDRPHSLSDALDINTQLARIGYVLVGQPWAIRLHSIVFSLGTIVLIWVVAKQCFDSRTAIIAAWLAAFSPYLMEFAAEARPNAIFIFAGILFLYALLRFAQNDSWPNTLLLMLSAGFGLLARPMFVSILIFGLSYYTWRKKRMTLKLALVFLSTLPFVVLVGYQAIVFLGIGPKESSDVHPSILNLVLRLTMAFNFGYSTLNYPERDAGWNISVRELLSRNPVYALICVLLLCAFLIGLIQLHRKARSKTVLLAGAVIIPIAVLIAVQETGFSLLNEKHCAGVVGAYYVLLVAIIVQISRHTWGKVAVLLYIFLVGISLFHFYFEPEIYSRRSNFTALNSYLTGELKDSDLLIGYHLSRERKPDYLTILDKADNFVDLYLNKPTDTSLVEYVVSLDAACIGKIYLIYDSRLRPLVDPSNSVLSVLKKHREYAMRRYGRNLQLYEFSEIGKCNPRPL